MKVNIQEILESTGLNEQLYPGKKVVKQLAQPGEFKSHCVVYDWHSQDTLRIEVKAGLSGRTLDAKELSNYPVSFQAATYLDIEASNDDDEEEGSESGSSGKSGGGGKKPAKKKEEKTSLSAFSKVVAGEIPSVGDITKMVVMGKEIAQQAMGAVLESLIEQIKHAKIKPTEMLAQAGKFITKVTPPEFMQKKDGQTYDKVYKYDREKNEIMFGAMGPG